jgi:RHS repeat-associated protein
LASRGSKAALACGDDLVAHGDAEHFLGDAGGPERERPADRGLHPANITAYTHTNNSVSFANIDSSDADVASLAYNALGQETRRKDQAGNVTETTYDTAGRPTVRAVTTLASGFDGAVRRLETTYTSKGQTDLVTQYDASSSGNVTDQVQFLYDDWGHVTNLRQDKDGTVAGGGFREVAYAYTSSPYQATGGAPGLRLNTITLPDGKEIDLTYGTANGIHDAAHRVADVKDVSTRSPYAAVTLATYAYLGHATLVGTDLPEPSAHSRLYGAGTANYDRLDVFNRVTASRWDRTGGGVITHVKLGYDRDSNIVTAEDEVLPGYDVKYDMDGLNRLIVADEGTLSSGSIGSRTRKEAWGLNQAGGWTSFTSDLNGDGSFSSPAFGPGDEKNETRTFSVVNEMLTRVNNGVTKSPAFNANGQQTDDGVNYTSEWDAFGRLRKVKNRTTSALVVEYTYNGLNMQIGRHADLDADGDVDATDKWEWTIYDPRWRRVATYMVAGGSTFGGSVDADAKERYVHHAAGRNGMGSYLDSVILRDRDQTNGNNGVADGTLEQRLYFGQNWRADVSVLMSDSGRILERIKYSAYGVATRVPVADFNRDGSVDFFDDADYDDCYTGAGCPAGQTADLNLDGFVDSFDYDEWDLNFAEQGITARGVLSQTDASAAVNRLGYAGYWFEPSTQQYLVRNREYDPNVGTWDERDPLEYYDGNDLYMYVQINPISQYDSSGTRSQSCAERANGCDGAVLTSPPAPYIPPHSPYPGSGGPITVIPDLTYLPFRWNDCMTNGPTPQCNNGYEIIPGTPPSTSNGCGTSPHHQIAAWAICGDIMGLAPACCDNHDVCYDTCGADKTLCDSLFRSCLHDGCNTRWPGWFYRYRRLTCLWCSRQFYNLVRTKGLDPFCTAQSSRCRCRTTP